MLKVICIVLICASVLVRAQDNDWEDYGEDYSEEYIDSPEFGAKHGLVINSLCRWKCDAAHSKNIRNAKHDRLCLYVCRGPAVTTTTQTPTVQATTIPEETAISYNHPLSHHDHHIISLICKPYCKPTTNNALRTYGYCAPFCHGNNALGKPEQQTEPTTTLAPTTPKPVPASQGNGHGIGHGISHGIGHGIGQGFSNYYHVRKFCRNHCTGQSYHYHRHPACPILCHSKPSSSPTTPVVSSASPTPSVSILTTSPSSVSGFPTLPPSASGSGSSPSGPSASGPSASGPSGPSGPSGSSGSSVSKPTGSSTSGPTNTGTTAEKPEDLVEAARLLKAFCTKFCPIETTFRRARSTMQERMCESLCDRSIPDSTTEKTSNKPPPMESSEKPAA